MALRNIFVSPRDSLYRRTLASEVRRNAYTSLSAKNKKILKTVELSQEELGLISERAKQEATSLFQSSLTATIQFFLLPGFGCLFIGLVCIILIALYGNGTLENNIFIEVPSILFVLSAISFLLIALISLIAALFVLGKYLLYYAGGKMFKLQEEIRTDLEVETALSKLPSLAHISDSTPSGTKTDR